VQQRYGQSDMFSLHAKLFVTFDFEPEPKHQNEVRLF